MEKRDYLLSCAAAYTKAADDFADKGNWHMVDEFRKWAAYCVERANNTASQRKSPA